MTSMDNEIWVEKAFVHGEYGMFYYGEHGIKQDKMLQFVLNEGHKPTSGSSTPIVTKRCANQGSTSSVSLIFHFLSMTVASQ